MKKLFISPDYKEFLSRYSKKEYQKSAKLTKLLAERHGGFWKDDDSHPFMLFLFSHMEYVKELVDHLEGSKDKAEFLELADELVDRQMHKSHSVRLLAEIIHLQLQHDFEVN